jgi:hypothetical protein
MIQPVHDAAQRSSGSEILSQCLQALEAGETTVESCIARFPNNPELPVLLHAMMAVQDLPRPLLPAANKAMIRQQMIAAYRGHWPVDKPGPQIARHPIPRWLQLAAAIGFLVGILALLVSSVAPAIEPLATSTDNTLVAPTMTLTLSPTTMLTGTPTATATLTETGTITLTPTLKETATLPGVGTATAALRPAITNIPTRVLTDSPTVQPAVQPTKRDAPSKTSPTPGVGNNNSNANGGQGKDKQ